MKRPAARQIFDVEVNGRTLGVVEEVPGAGWASFTNSGRRIGVFERPAEASAAVVRMAGLRRTAWHQANAAT